MDKVIEKTIENLQKNNMAVYFAQDRAEALEIAKGLMKKGDTVTCGGSVTLSETGIRQHLSSGEYNFLDRSLAKDGEELEEIYRKSFYADVYLTSANAVTEKGELVNVDGNCNRVAAILFGPKSVICVVGKNKIVSDVDAGFKRIKEIAAPLNTKRLGLKTPCAETGICCKAEEKITAGCMCDDRICVNYVVSGRQRVKERVKVILVNENLGY